MTLKRIIILRHAESQEDVNPNLHGEVPDKQISITPKGVRQAEELLQKIFGIASKYKSVEIYSSPSKRAVQTSKIIKFGLGESVCNEITVEPRIRNLNWGNVTPETVKDVEKERYRVGVLHFQFPDGDHTPTFVSKINEFVEEILQEGEGENSSELLIIITHGFALRVIIKSLLQMSESDFRWIKNPPNCYLADFRVDNSGKVSLREPLPKRDPA